MTKLILLFNLIAVNLVCGQSLSWEQTNGPLGGFVTTLAVNTNDNIFAGTPEGLLFRSTDNGNTWAVLNQGVDRRVVRKIKTVGSERIYWCSGNGVFGSSFCN